MATSDRDLEWFLARTPEREPDLPSLAAGDLGRLSVEAFIARSAGTERVLPSRGELRLHGAGVQGHKAELAHVGIIASAWQKAVSATGAALENIRPLRGSLPSDITQRTTLVLNAAPSPGSIVLHLEPKSAPMDEVEPHGNISIVDTPRPLADRASEQLVRLLAQASPADLEMLDTLADALRSLGPRVGSSLSSLAQAIHRADITVDASWAEPSSPTIKASVNPAAARWLREFVAGRGLDAEEQTLTGTLRTVSDRQPWLIELTSGEIERMSADELASEEVARWRVGDVVELQVRSVLREQPDGNIHRSHTILDLRAADR
ncbi:hypothetical protein ACFQ07_31195 [Actinomadura adrarensis]|uniref:S1 motif domain-containing protein n=1 Tax=Actinomadura adrarensis TaxID=1819600 RepID=A0ABW3CS35_9ACTN